MISKAIARRLMIALFVISISVASASGTGGLFREMIETEYTDDRLEAIVLELMNRQEEESPLVSLANPWTELPAKQQLEDVAGIRFSIPQDEETILYRCLQDEGLAEVQFSRDGDEYCVRAVNQTEGRPDDISGLYYEWTDEETFGFGNCSGIFGRAQDGSRWVERCLWVDPNHEVNWSLAVFTADPGSLDIVGIAEKICLPDNAGI